MNKQVIIALVTVGIGSLGSVANASDLDATYENEFLTYLSLNHAYDYEQNADDITQYFYPDVWHKYGGDEFARHDKEAEAINNVKSKIAAMPSPATFVIRVRSTYGDYDFKAQKFAFQPLDKFTNYGTACEAGAEDLERCGLKIPHDMEFILDNSGMVTGLAMNPTDAKNLLESEPLDTLGKPYRNAYVLLHVQVKKVLTYGERFAWGYQDDKQKPQFPSYLAAKKDQLAPVLSGHIIAAEAYADPAMTHLIGTWH